MDTEFFKRSWKEKIKETVINEEVSEKDLDITRFDPAHNKIAAINQVYSDDSYSYMEGYYKAFKSAFNESINDTDSYVMPLMFLARQYMELSLKESIFYLSVCFGNSIEIGKFNNHNLKVLLHDFQKIIYENNLNDIIPYYDPLYMIIHQISQLSKYSDEFRYPFDNKGIVQFKGLNCEKDINKAICQCKGLDCKKNEIRLIDLNKLNNNLDYIYQRLQNLIIYVCEPILDEQSVYDTFKQHIIRRITSNRKLSDLKKSGKLDEQSIRDYISGLVDYNAPGYGNHLTINITENSGSNHISIVTNKVNWLELIGDKENKWWLKTRKVVD